MKKNLTAATLGLAFLWSGSALAAGYQLNEYSVSGLGRSFAGAGVVGDDYSALAYNPAGMTLLSQSGLQGGLTVAQVNSHIRGENGEKAGMDFGVPLPNFFGQYSVNERLKLGFGIYAPFGLETRHSRYSFLSNDAVESTLKVIDFAPAAAYKLTDKLSVGGTFIARYIKGNMTNTLANPYTGQRVEGSWSEFDLDGWTYTGIIGAMYEFTPDTRLGVSYKAKSKQTVKGDHTISGYLPMLNGVYGDGRASPDLPPSVLISAYHRLNDDFGLSASARWTDWTVFDEFSMTSNGGALGATVDESWKDTWTLSAGVDYYLNSEWTLRFGGAWDQSPVPDDKHRTARIPDSDRIWVSTGISYAYENLQFDFGYAHLFMKEAKLVKGVNSSRNAEYDSYSNMYGLQMQYKF